MELYHHGALLGTLARYGYETPWSSAWLEPLDTATVARYAAVSAFLAWADSLPDDLSDAEADARYEQELAARGLDQAAVEGFSGGWEVRMPDGEMREIWVSSFDADGWLSWR